MTSVASMASMAAIAIKSLWFYCVYQCSALKMSKVAIVWIAASDDLGGWIWGHPVPLNRGRWTTLKSCLDPEKCFLLCFFDTPNSPCEVTASEAAEAGLIVTMTWPTLSTTHMQSFNLLALKLWICIGNTRMYRQLLRFEVYIVRFEVSKLQRQILDNLNGEKLRTR